MIQVQVIYGSQASDVQDGVNLWLRENANKVTILRIGDAMPKGDNGGAYLTIVYTTSQEDVFDKEIPE